MKNSIYHKFSRFFIALVAIGVLNSCGDAFFDINKTPNNPVEVPPQVLLPTVLLGSGFANNNEINRFAAVQANYLAGAGGSPGAWDIYNMDITNFNNQWNSEFYAGVLTTSEELIKAARRTNSPIYEGIAKIMKAYAFSMVTDLWGDVPYSEALKGTGNVKPRIDKQEDIYKGNSSLGIQSLFDLVREGLADLDKTGGIRPAADDVVYGGNIGNWKRAANTLLLKLAIQISVVEPQLATSVINEVLARGEFINSNAQDFNVKFGTSVGGQCPAHTYTNVSLFRNDLIMSTRFYDVLNNSRDPRLSRFFTSPAGEYVGIDNGFGGALPQPVTRWSRYNAYVTGVNGEGPVRLLTNFQRAFILAEAVVRLGVAGDANQYFQEGIRASMTLAGVSNADINAYFTANPSLVTLSGTRENQLRQILTQKWIAWFGNGYEAYNDWRRTGFPVIPESQNARGIDGTRPVRVLYPNDELLRNPNFNNKFIDSNVKVWWDVN